MNEDGDELFDMANELEHDIMTAQNQPWKNLWGLISSITDSWPDPDEDEDYEEEEDWPVIFGDA